MTTSRLALARLIALLLPAALLAGALGSEFLGGLFPCEMCHWQRWPHYAAVPVALVAILVRGRVPLSRALTMLAAVLILASGLIGAFHAGVEYHWWEGFTTCSSTMRASTGDFLRDILAAPPVRCDQAQWTLFGVSLAGFNALFSVGGALLILGLCRPTR